jgi:TonB family protein
MPRIVPPNIEEQEQIPQRAKLAAGAGVLLLAGSFTVGSLIHQADAQERKAPEATRPVMSERLSRAEVTLVPVGSVSSFEPPITSAPPIAAEPSVAPEYQRSDATAVASDVYAQLVARESAEREKNELVDPRSITTAAYAEPPRPETPDEAPSAEAYDAALLRARRMARTEPVPEYQPLPDFEIRESASARLSLIVGPDGRVREVSATRNLPEHMDDLLAAARKWRFKPATENSLPVAARFSVEISFRAND